jgi:hypothetical protein
MVAAEPRYEGTPAVAPGEVVPLTSRAERKASRRRSAYSFPAQTMRERRLGTPAGTVPGVTTEA